MFFDLASLTKSLVTAPLALVHLDLDGDIRDACGLSEWESLGFEPARQAWSARSCTLGHSVTLSTPQGPLRGTAAGLDPDGALRLRDAGGTLHSVICGEIPLPQPVATH